MPHTLVRLLQIRPLLNHSLHALLRARCFHALREPRPLGSEENKSWTNDPKYRTNEQNDQTKRLKKSRES